MLYMLDTDICSYIMKQMPLTLLSTMEAKVEEGHALCISVITYSELRIGAERSKTKKKYHDLINELSERFDFIADWTTTQADQFAKLHAHLLSKGKPIGPNDTMIAAHAQTLEATLVTNNLKHFKQVPKISLENWV